MAAIEKALRPDSPAAEEGTGRTGGPAAVKPRSAQSEVSRDRCTPRSSRTSPSNDGIDASSPVFIGISGVASAALGQLADYTSIQFVFGLCAYLPLVGVLAAFLPNIERR